MSSSHIEGINWFPRNSDYFVTWGSDIKLYKIVQKSKAPNFQTSKIFSGRSFPPI